MSSVRPCHNTRNFWKFHNTFIPVPETSGSSVRLPYRTRNLQTLQNITLICCTYKKTCPEKITISHLTGTFLGVLNSSTFYTFWVLDRRAHDRDLLCCHRENTHAQNTTFNSRPFVGYVLIPRKRHVLLGGYDRPTPMAWDVAYKYCRKKLKEHILRTREQEDNTSYADALAKTASESIEAIVRKRRIFFT